MARCAARLRQADHRRVDHVRRVTERAEQPAVADHGRPVDQVDHDDGDVVVAAGTQRQLGERRRGVLVLLRRQYVGDHGVRHQVGEPVAGQQQPVTDRHVESHDVGATALRVAVDRPEHDVAPRVHGAVLGSQLAGVDQVLDVGVVLGELAQRQPSRQQVAAGVADVAERDVMAVGHQHRQRGGHAEPLEVALDPDPDPGGRGGVRLRDHPLRGLPRATRARPRWRSRRRSRTRSHRRPPRRRRRRPARRRARRSPSPRCAGAPARRHSPLRPRIAAP